MNDDAAIANLRTGENRKYDCSDELVDLDPTSMDESAKAALVAETNGLVLELLGVPDPGSWSVRHTTSGTDNIRTMVNTFCTGEDGENVLLHTDKYAGTASAAIKKGNGASFTVIKFRPGGALTRSSPEFERLSRLIRENVDSIYLVWNSTSTGALVDPQTVEDLVALRDEVGSETLIIVDGATYAFFTSRWRDFTHYGSGRSPVRFGRNPETGSVVERPPSLQPHPARRSLCSADRSW